MESTNAVTALGLTASPDVWTAWSAVGTVGATGVALLALGIPLIGAWRRRRKARKEEQDRYREIISAVTNALIFLENTRHDFEAATTRMGLAERAGVARYKAQTLRLLAGKPGLTDGAIDSALGAEEVLRLVGMADENLQNGRTQDAKGDLISAFSIARNVKSRIEKVAAYRELTIWAGKIIPALDYPPGSVASHVITS